MKKTYQKPTFVNRGDLGKVTALTPIASDFEDNSDAS
jgi:hypothetical protein